jgi:hypothetical protein
MPDADAARMTPRARTAHRSSYLLRILASSFGRDAYRYELHELRSGRVRTFESLAALQGHLGRAEACGWAVSNVESGTDCE